MAFFGDERKIDISARSGIVRVNIDPRPNIVLLCLEAALIVGFDGGMLRMWSTLSWISRAFILWATFGGITAWLYQLSGYETIEFDSMNLTISISVLGWERSRQYPLEKCGQLEWRDLTHEDPASLRLHCGHKTIKFGKYLSGKRAEEVLVLLQKELPDTARHLLADSTSNRSHVQTLGLS